MKTALLLSALALATFGRSAFAPSPTLGWPARASYTSLIAPNSPENLPYRDAFLIDEPRERSEEDEDLFAHPTLARACEFLPNVRPASPPGSMWDRHALNPDRPATMRSPLLRC